jgi:hypothetical protein
MMRGTYDVKTVIGMTAVTYMRVARCFLLKFLCKLSEDSKT